MTKRRGSKEGTDLAADTWQLAVDHFVNIPTIELRWRLESMHAPCVNAKLRTARLRWEHTVCAVPRAVQPPARLRCQMKRSAWWSVSQQGVSSMVSSHDNRLDSGSR